MLSLTAFLVWHHLQPATITDFQPEVISESNDNSVQIIAQDVAMQTESFPEAQSEIIPITLPPNPSSALKGLVVSSEGRPLPGVSVTCASGDPGAGIQFEKGILRSWLPQNKIVLTDAQGKFTIAAPPEYATTVVAAGSNGFGTAPIDQVRTNGFLVFKEFGRIAGTLKIAGEPAANHELLFSLPNSAIQMNFEDYKSETDGQGHFAIENVPAGEGALARLIKIPPSGWLHSHDISVTVEPGKTTQVTLGDSGAVLQGTVRFETPPAEAEAYTITGRLSSEVNKVPEFGSFDLAQSSIVSPEWKQQMTRRNCFSAAMNTDGSIQFDSIPPGTYTLEVTAIKPEESWRSPYLMQNRQTIVVPDLVNPYFPITIGEIVLNP